MAGQLRAPTVILIYRNNFGPREASLSLTLIIAAALVTVEGLETLCMVIGESVIIGNLVTLAETTHKFEKHYTDRLIDEVFDVDIASTTSSKIVQ